MPVQPSAAEIDLALARSALYEALSLGFRPPGQEPWQRLAGPDAARALGAAADLVGGSLPSLVHRFCTSAAAAAPDALGAAHRHLFGHTAHGSAPPYETEYGQDTLFQKPQELADVAGFFSAFGLVLDPGSRERVDHVSCELEFLAFLARKEALALERRDEAMAAVTRTATRSFLRDHLARFAPSFCRRVMREDGAGFHGRLAELCLHFVRRECERLDVAVGPEMLELRLPVEDAVPTACDVTSCFPEAGRDGPASALLSIEPPRERSR